MRAFGEIIDYDNLKFHVDEKNVHGQPVKMYKEAS